MKYYRSMYTLHKVRGAPGVSTLFREPIGGKIEIHIKYMNHHLHHCKMAINRVDIDFIII